MAQKNLFVISLGGSLINPGTVDSEFLKKFHALILQQTAKGKKFILISGGGKLCRDYQQALAKIIKPSNNDLDWLGIYTTRFNAELIRLMFGKLAHPDIVLKFDRQIKTKAKILVGGGWKPGRSSDGAMVKLAQTFGATTVINLSNIDYVYTKDPRKHSDAKKIEKTSWSDFLKITGRKWDPGKNLPFDPTAAIFAQKNRLKVIIANGKNLNNLKNILNGKKFIGTIIS